MKTEKTLNSMLMASILCALVFVAGCGGEEYQEVNLEQQAENLQTSFSDAEPEVQEEMNTAVQAIKEENYGTAYMKLRQMQQNDQRPMSELQGLEAMQTMKNLRIHIANLAAQGDPNAKRLMKDIERMQFQ